MSESLPSCAALHPGVPSRIIAQQCNFKNRTPFVRRVCRACHSVRASRQQRAHGDFVSRPEKPRKLTPYGVLPAPNWTPPERALQMLNGQPTNFEALYFRLRTREPLREATCI